MARDDATVTGMAGRYGGALYDLAAEQDAVDPVLADLDRFIALAEESDELARLIRSPVFSSDEQLRAVAAVLDRVAIGGLAANFVKLAAKNRRLFAVRDMILAFKKRVAQARGETTAEVTVAEPLSDPRLAEIKDALREVTGKDVQVVLKIDPAVIGGLVVKLGSRMVDSSLRTKLNALQLAMKEVR